MVKRALVAYAVDVDACANWYVLSESLEIPC